MKKKLLAILFVAMVAMLTFAVSASAATGTTGNCTYVLDDATGVLTISGTGTPAANTVSKVNATEIIIEEGVVALPHLGASTPESEDNCAKMAALEIIDYLENGNIKNAVNMPASSMPRSGKARICVIHKNVTAMVSQITSVVSDGGVNIENMQNTSRKEMAYTMLDVAEPIGKETADKLAAIEGVIKVRVL